MAKTGQRLLPMTVGNLGFLIDRLGVDCAPLQQIRELTQNAIEAIKRNPDGKGKILWDMDYELWNACDPNARVRKLCIIDTGEGMTDQDMLTYINAISKSSSKQTMKGNYGVGAKIAAATRNPFGIIYNSWKDDVGHSIHLHKDADGLYGLKQFDRGDDDYGHSIELDDSAKPESIKTHGTKVTLLGASQEEDTMIPPEGTPLPSSWIVPCLNTRYFTFPEGVEVHGSELWNTAHYTTRRVYGQKHFLDKNKRSSGTVKLTDAVAHWWIMAKDAYKDRARAEYAARHHMAALYQNELYEITPGGRPSTNRLQQFGITWGYKHLVIYVEPIHRKLTTNTPRTQLIMAGEPLPWDDWANEFRVNLPPEIIAFMEEEALNGESEDQSESIQQRLKKVSHLYKISRYKLNRCGPVNSDETFEVQETNVVLVPDLFKDLSELPGTDEEGNGKGIRRRVHKESFDNIMLRLQKKNKGDRSTEIESDKYPKVAWIDLANGKRSPGDLEDRAARWVPNAYIIQANGDFRVFEDMVKSVMLERKFTGQAKEREVRNLVRDWYGQALVETVVGVMALSGREWSKADVEKALSEESLTATVMQKYHVYHSVRRSVGNKFGGVNEDAKKDGDDTDAAPVAVR